MRRTAHPGVGQAQYGAVMDDEGVPEGTTEVIGELAPTDEEAARQARERYREVGLPMIESDAIIAPYLAVGEKLVGYRPNAGLGRVDESTRAAVRDEGPLYVTDRRIVHLGRQTMSIPLADIDELAMADDRILATLSGARGVTLDVAEPRQLRVLIAAAKSAARN